MDVNFTWSGDLSEAQAAAFAIAMKHKPRKMTEFELAEFIMLADQSLWYHQAKGWAKKPPEAAKGAAGIVWQTACSFIVSVVESGWDGKVWWGHLAGYSKEKLAAKLLLLMDFGMMLGQYRSQSMSIVSQGFEIFIDLVAGKTWKSKYKKFLKTAGSKTGGG